jgi:hypothetical protein
LTGPFGAWISEGGTLNSGGMIDVASAKFARCESDHLGAGQAVHAISYLKKNALQLTMSISDMRDLKRLLCKLVPRL